ncbi:hypothetical protein Pst134EA_030299 [Puccinia striiformis f. sp. tritici]|uniref:Secreted protein n=3 Tax=Puccinia striiformis TaxID=27350 RepID=A0A0L0V8N9_9BASI|nr:hypothetical protein Pst134EA_030299 [Puccinia striiformis f. sp. tritici]KAI9601906.1 hypothetical protein KEM48_001194 [Puccinia striiformis f. sp. tritici PST-130]KNE95551.1 hypothetical protein PSTG_11156 [Puccinia striiformis f. sp. tritici PST-78]POW16011.1 hypothetical protein PSTT_01543 [Puccinia striiformis]KAH9440218.1 hypothetical protein Pst134EB_030845 [Puccinia striiformis f. sp. tritici]KAH9446378.1 hypothetical protein Pst134EA_030299 [Puccinia striiformis f. sp. tritici]
MQLLNILQISMVLLIQGGAAYTNTPNNFGCAGRVPDHSEAGCVANLPESNGVRMMVAPWNDYEGAYDCSQADPSFKRATCCSDPSDLKYQLSIDIWKQKCREIDGSEIKQY